MPDRSAIALAPEGTRSWLGEAVEAGGATIVEPAEADGLVWTDPADPAGLGALLDAHRHIDWVQLPWAGIEPYVEVVRAHAERTWTCGKGVYAEPVAEHALALALAGLRHLGPYAGRALVGTHRPAPTCSAPGSSILGGGGITESLLRLLGPFGCDVTVVRRTAGADGGRRHASSVTTSSTTPSRAPSSSCWPSPSPRRPPASSTGAGSSCSTRTAGW